MENKTISGAKEFKYIESKQSANTLFKFMKKIDYLKEIIENSAIIPRYNNEIIEYLKLGVVNEIAFPMICFCDINLTKLKSHSEIYGSFRNRAKERTHI